jgi:capsular polysaccharide biosynthesis protein
MPVLYADRWDAAGKGWKKGEEPPTAWDAYRLFDRNVRFVNKDVKTGLVTLAIEWRDPDSAALWANRLVQRINAERRAEAIREAETSISYLKEQLAETSLVEMQQAIYQLIESKIRKIMVAKSLDEYAFRVIDPAVPPQEYSSPRRVPIIILGIVFGLIVSAVIVLVRSRFAGASRG